MEDIHFYLTKADAEFVTNFIRKQKENPSLYYKLWLDAFKSMFDTENYMPTQFVIFYVLSGAELIKYTFVAMVSNLSFNGFLDDIKHRVKPTDQLIGPYVSEKYSSEWNDEMISIIKMYNRYSIQGMVSNHGATPQSMSNLI